MPHTYSVVVQDLATQWIHSFLCKNQISSGDDVKFANVPFLHPDKSEIHSHRQLSGVCQSLRRTDLESWDIYSGQTRNKRHCRTSTTTSERGIFVSIGSFWTSRMMVGRSNGVLLPFARPTWKQMTRRLMNVGSIHQLMADHSFGSWVKLYFISANDKGPVHHFGSKVLLVVLMVYALNGAWSWIGFHFLADAEDLKTMPPSGIHEKINSKEVYTPRETMNVFFFVERAKHCKNGSRFSPLCAKREVISGNVFKNNLQKKKGRDRHPSPDLEAWQDFWSIIGFYMY